MKWANGLDEAVIGAAMSELAGERQFRGDHRLVEACSQFHREKNERIILLVNFRLRERIARQEAKQN